MFQLLFCLYSIIGIICLFSYNDTCHAPQYLGADLQIIYTWPTLDWTCKTENDKL